MFRRHPFVSSLALLLLLALAGLATFIATFDLNRYREQLQTRLSTALSQPVYLGEAGLSWRHGPAFSFADLRIGSGEGETGVLLADHLLLKLELLPLLKREVTFSAILLEAPHLSITFNPPVAAEAEPSPALRLDQGVLDSALIRSLEISNGTLHLLDHRDPERPYAITLENLDGQFSNISLNQPCRLRLGGNLAQEGTSSPFALAGVVHIGDIRPAWHDLEVDLELRLNKLVPEPLWQRYASGMHQLHTAGSLALELKLSGSPATGLQFAGRVDSKELQLRLPDLYQEPLRWQQIQFKGNWSRQTAVQTLTDLSLQADGLTLTGAATLEQQDGQPWLTAELSSGRLPLLEIGRFIPDRSPESSLHSLWKNLGGGTAELELVRFSGPMAGFSRLDANFPLQQGTLRVRDAVLRLERGGRCAGSTLMPDWKTTCLPSVRARVRFSRRRFAFRVRWRSPSLRPGRWRWKPQGSCRFGRCSPCCQHSGRRISVPKGRFPLR
jgi:uncharacterized protein YhdP